MSSTIRAREQQRSGEYKSTPQHKTVVVSTLPESRAPRSRCDIPGSSTAPQQHRTQIYNEKTDRKSTSSSSTCTYSTGNSSSRSTYILVLIVTSYCSRAGYPHRRRRHATAAAAAVRTTLYLVLQSADKRRLTRHLLGCAVILCFL